jgi:fructokinase
MQLQQTYRSEINRRSPTVVGTGLVALDVLSNAPKCVPDTALGGSAGNVLAILSHLGWHSIPVAELGVDSAAEKILQEFALLGADTRFLRQRRSTHTPVVFQLPGTGGATHEFSFSCPVCGLKRGYLPPVHDFNFSSSLANISAPDVFFFDRVNIWALELAERYRGTGTLVVFEPSAIDTDDSGFQRAIRAAHVLKYANDRISHLERFDRSTVNIEILTSGKDGLAFRENMRPNSWYRLPAYNVPFVADTAGAGDWCTSGFLSALIGNIFEGADKGGSDAKRIHESLRVGQALAALNCMEVGARGLARTRSRDEIVHLALQLKNLGSDAKIGVTSDNNLQRKKTSAQQEDQRVEFSPAPHCCKEHLLF